MTALLYLGDFGMITEHLVDISRLQFATTALFHFLFVPLTLGMTWLLVIMEAVYLITGKQIWKDMTRFGANYLELTLCLGLPQASQWNFNLVPTGHITHIMWAMYLVRHWLLKG